MDIDALKKQAEEFRKNKQFEQALPILEELWLKHRSDRNEWDGWKYAFCLRKVGLVEKALDICREVYKIKPDFDQNKSLYAWCIYDSVFTGTMEKDINEVLKGADAILNLTSPSKFSPCMKTIFKVIDRLDDNIQDKSEEKLKWLDRVSPDNLSTECDMGPGKDGKQVEFASEKEKWYSAKCKALLELERYQECIDVANTALDVFPRFHNDNDVWFKYRIALSKGKTGQIAEAIAELLSLLSRKKDWFFFYEIADLYYQSDDLENAKKFAAEALTAPGQKDNGFRLKAFHLLGLILNKQGKLDLAREHILLENKLRMENGWKTGPKLDQLNQELQVNLIDKRSSQEIYNSLKTSWSEIVHSDAKQLTGKIKNIVGEGKSGFIRGDDNKEYYFKLKDYKGKSSEVVAGLKVKFFIKPTSVEGKHDWAVEIEATQ